MKRNQSLTLLSALFAFSGAAWAGTSYTTMPASDITATSATLNATAQSTLGLSGEKFHWGLSKDQLTNTALGSPQGVPGPVSLPITGLTCNTTYYFQFTGDPKPPRTTNQGSVLSFQTAPCPQKYVDVNAGSIFDNRAAQGICPGVCTSAGGTWSGQWTNQVSPSVCGCWIPE